MHDEQTKTVPAAPTRSNISCPHCKNFVTRMVLISSETTRGIALECAALSCQKTIANADTLIGKMWAETWGKAGML